MQSVEQLPSEVLNYHKFKPRAHQMKFVDRFGFKDSALAFHDRGTGKTFTMIMWARFKYYLEQRVLKTLIIGPVATLYNWDEEWRMHSPESTSKLVKVLYGTSRKPMTMKDRIAALKDPDKKIFIVNPHAFDSDEFAEAVAKEKFELLIIDELHEFKNFKAKRVKTLIPITDKIKYKCGGTGTPILLKTYTDLWAQFRLIDNGRTLGRSFYPFRNKYFVDKNAGMPAEKYYPEFVPKESTAQEIEDLLDSTTSRVTTAECLDLPPLVKQYVRLEMSKEQAKLYNALDKELVATVKGGSCTTNIAIVKVARMLEVLNGNLTIKKDGDVWESQYDEETGMFVGNYTDAIHKIEDNPKLEQLDKDLEELTIKNKVIVWVTQEASYDDVINIAKQYSKKVAEITGRTHGGHDGRRLDKREENLLFENDDDCRVIVSNPQAGGTGINLISARYSIGYSRTWSLKDYLQREARNYRSGSEIHESIIQIEYVVNNSYEETVLQSLTEKDNFATKVLEKLRV